MMFTKVRLSRWWLLILAVSMSVTEVAMADILKDGDVDCRYMSPTNISSAEQSTSTQYDWEALGQGVGSGDQCFTALSMYDNQPVAGIVNGVYVWDGSSWSQLGQIGGFHTSVYALTVFNGNLVAGGSFDSASGAVGNHVAAWDGSTWHPLGSGTAEYVYALAVYDNKLIAGCSAGGFAANSIRVWDGSSWSSLGSGVGGDWSVVWSLAIYDGKLFAGGYFREIVGAVGNCVAVWDGVTWSRLGSGMSGTEVRALTVFDNKLIAGGFFGAAGGVEANNVAAWNGAYWSSLGSGVGGPSTGGEVYALTVYNDELIAAGSFASTGSVAAKCVATFDGIAWSSLGLGMGRYYGSPCACALIAYGGDMIAAGQFDTAGCVPARNIAAWREVLVVDGDVSNDGAVDISDAVYLIAYIFSGGQAPCHYNAANANCDDTVDISDAVYLIAFIFSGGPAPGEGCK